ARRRNQGWMVDVLLSELTERALCDPFESLQDGIAGGVGQGGSHPKGKRRSRREEVLERRRSGRHVDQLKINKSHAARQRTGAGTRLHRSTERIRLDAPRNRLAKR